MRILILGAGATGGYFGARFIEAGLDVTFLVRPRRAAQLAASGLRLTSPMGDFHGPARTCCDLAQESPFDLIILSCKAYDLDSAIDAIEPAMAPRTLVLPLLNGVAHLDQLDARLGAARVLGGFCHLGVTTTADGAILHLNQLDSLTLGARCADQQAAVAALGAHLGRARLTLGISARILDEMWQKYVFVTVLAGMTCLMRGSVGEIAATTLGAALTAAMFDCCARVAACAGHPLPADWQASALAALTQHGSASTASMLRDVRRGARTEHEQLFGFLLERCRAERLDASLLAAAYTQLQVHAAQTGEQRPDR